MENRDAGVYLHVIPKSKRIFYVGYTCDIEGSRSRHGIRELDIHGKIVQNTRNVYWQNTVLKHGIEVIIFFRGGKKEALKTEEELIAAIGVENLVNMTTGGEHPEHTLEVRAEMSRRLCGHVVTEETKRKMSASHRLLKNAAAVEIEQLNEEGMVIATYKSIRDAAKALGLSNHTHLSRCVKEPHRRSKGFRWREKLTI